MHCELLAPEQLPNPPEDSCGLLRALAGSVSCTSENCRPGTVCYVVGSSKAGLRGAGEARRHRGFLVR